MHNLKSFYIIDCSYHFRASYFALPKILTPSGELVNAVYGFLSIMLKLIREHKPNALAVADDAPGCYFRHELFPKYKSEKKRVPLECDHQMPFLQIILRAMKIPYLTAKGFEADDVIATLTQLACNHKYHVYICSKDKDLSQLLADNVSIFDTTKAKEVTPVVLQRQRGIRPDQIPDMLALIGDKADTIPGVPKIGPKTAARLLQSYDNVEKIIEHCEEIGGRLGVSIKEHHDQLLFAKELTTLRRDVPLNLKLEACSLFPPNRAILEPIFRELGFESLLKRLDRIL